MTVCGRRIGIAMLIKLLMMLSRLLVGHRIDSVWILMLVFLVGCRDGKRSQRSLVRHRRKADVLVRHLFLQKSNVIPQSQVLMLENLAVLLHSEGALQVIL